MSLSWDAVVVYALSLPGTELTTYYGRPAVKADDRAVVTPSHEPDSFCLHIDRGKVEMLKAIDPDTFWQTPHYEGYPALLVCYDTDNAAIVKDQIAASRDWAMARPKPRSRKKWSSGAGRAWLVPFVSGRDRACREPISRQCPSICRLDKLDGDSGRAALVWAVRRQFRPSSRPPP